MSSLVGFHLCTEAEPEVAGSTSAAAQLALWIFHLYLLDVEATGGPPSSPFLFHGCWRPELQFLPLDSKWFIH